MNDFKHQRSTVVILVEFSERECCMILGKIHCGIYGAYFINLKLRDEVQFIP